MTISDTAGMIRAIDALSVEQCEDDCWCRLTAPITNTKERFRWSPGQPVLRFGTGEAA